MSTSNRLISPYWEIKNHCFVPINWETVPRTPDAIRLISKIQHTILDTNIPIFIRGSILEEVHPHPKADIDIIYIAPQSHTTPIFSNLRRCTQRDIDINVYSKDASEPKYFLLPLLHVRAMQISGPHLHQQHIPVNLDFVFNLWNQYNISQLPRIITADDPKRISRLKQLFRTLGLLSLLHGDGFTRDIHSCLDWLHEQDVLLSTTAQQIWMQRTEATSVNIASILKWEHQIFEKYLKYKHL